MKSDIEIAQAANMIPIWEVAEQLNIPKDELEMYGKYKAKLGDELWDRVKDNPSDSDQSYPGRRGQDNNFRWSWTGYG